MLRLMAGEVPLQAEQEVSVASQGKGGGLCPTPPLQPHHLGLLALSRWRACPVVKRPLKFWLFGAGACCALMGVISAVELHGEKKSAFVEIVEFEYRHYPNCRLTDSVKALRECFGEWKFGSEVRSRSFSAEVRERLMSTPQMEALGLTRERVDRWISGVEFEVEADGVDGNWARARIVLQADDRRIAGLLAEAYKEGVVAFVSEENRNMEERSLSTLASECLAVQLRMEAKKRQMLGMQSGDDRMRRLEADISNDREILTGLQQKMALDRMKIGQLHHAVRFVGGPSRVRCGGGGSDHSGGV